jgi:capsule polysaccharide export protein KpsE/RkpR
VTQTGAKQGPEATPQTAFKAFSEDGGFVQEPREAAVQRLRLLWENRRFLIVSTIAGVVLGTFIALLLPNRYESTAQLMPPDSQSGTGMALLAALSNKMETGLGAVAGDLLGLKSNGALFIGVLHSRTVQDRLIERFDLRKVYKVRLVQTARKELADNTSISEDRKSGILTIVVTDKDAKRAAAMAKAYVEELDRLVAKVSTSSARREREFLEGRLKSVDADLESAEKEFSQFSSKNAAIDIKEQGRAMVEAAAVLQGHLIAAESELEGLRQIYTDDNVRVRAVRARIDELKHQLERMGGKGEELAASSEHQSGDSLYPSIRKLPLLGVQYADLYRRTKVQEAVFEALTKQYELAKVQEAKEIPSVKVLDEPRVPEKKSFPPRFLIMFTCAFLTLVGAVVFARGKMHWAEIDDADPHKAFAQEIFQAMKVRLPWTSSNGFNSRGATVAETTDLSRRSHSTGPE